MHQQNFILILLSTSPVVEPASSTTSAVWNPSHDSSQLSGTPVGQRIDNHVYRQSMQTEKCSLLTSNNSNHISRTLAEGGWLSSSHGKASRSKISDEMEDRSASAWSVPRSYLNQISTHQCNDPLPHPIVGTKSDTVVSCRLFGFDLKSPSTGVALSEMAPSRPTNVTLVTAEANVPSTLSAGDSEAKSDLSKDSKQKHQGHLQVSPKEVQSKQSCSTRSRTKVYNDCAAHIKMLS